MKNNNPDFSKGAPVYAESNGSEKGQPSKTNNIAIFAVGRGIIHDLLNQIDDTQTFLLGCKWAKDGRDFFEALAEYLAKNLGMDFVCIYKLLEDNLEAETVAVFYDGKFEDNTRYKLDETPCGKVIGHTVCCFPENVRHLFPNDKVLQEMVAESYVGITLWDAYGKPIGLIAVIGRKPLVNNLVTEMVLKQVSIRAAAELEHRRSEALIRDKEGRLARLYEYMNEGLAIHDIIYTDENAVDYLIVDINPAYENITGISRNSAIGKKASELYGTGEAPYLDIFSRVASGGPPEYFETYYPPLKKHLSISVFSPESGKFATVFTDVSERKLKEETLKKLNHMLGALEKSSQAMAYSMNEKAYLEKVCNIIVEDCGFAMVWIGYAAYDKEQSIKPVASAGFDKGYLDTLSLTWADTERGRGPTGSAIRTRKICTSSNMASDPAFKPWREEALKRGYASSIALPLITEEKVFGSLTIYARNPDAFSNDEIKLLTELANDLSHGISAIRLREAHTHVEEELSRSRDELEIIVGERTSELKKANILLRKEIKVRKSAEKVLTDSQKQLRALTHRMDLVAEEERKRIAREVHDELGHLLTALKYDVEDLSKRKIVINKEAKGELDSISGLLDTLIDSVRKISTELRPGILDHLGLFPAIEWHIKQFQKRTKLCCITNIHEDGMTFTKDETTIIFRILQEILTNVARHSQATKVDISVRKINGCFFLEVIDNGVGFDIKRIKKSTSSGLSGKKEIALGLLGMKERALSIGGEIQIESSPGKGTAISLRLRRNQ